MCIVYPVVCRCDKCGRFYTPKGHAAPKKEDKLKKIVSYKDNMVCAGKDKGWAHAYFSYWLCDACITQECAGRDQVIADYQVSRDLALYTWQTDGEKPERKTERQTTAIKEEEED